MRSYLDTQVSFLEIKARDNRGRMRKSRVIVRNHHDGIAALSELSAALTEGLDSAALVPVLGTNFSRAAPIQDLRVRTGLDIHRVDVQQVEFLRDAARLTLYHHAA